MPHLLKFVLYIWQRNFVSALQYRVSFLLQTIGMMLNNTIFIVFWVLFFERFGVVKGWGMPDILLLTGIATFIFGASVLLFGNVTKLAGIIANGGLDYFLSFPKPALLHLLISRSVQSGLGDMIYGALCFALSGYLTPQSVPRFLLGAVLGVIILVSFLVIVGSLSFWLGNSELLASQATMSIITLSTYPSELFTGFTRGLLLVGIPALAVGALPANFTKNFSWEQLGILCLLAGGFLSAALIVFRQGLKRYESGNSFSASR